MPSVPTLARRTERYHMKNNQPIHHGIRVVNQAARCWSTREVVRLQRADHRPRSARQVDLAGSGKSVCQIRQIALATRAPQWSSDSISHRLLLTRRERNKVDHTVWYTSTTVSRYQPARFSSRECASNPQLPGHQTLLDSGFGSFDLGQLVAHRLDNCRIVRLTENSRACDKGIGTSFCNRRDVSWTHTTIDLKANI